MPVGNHAPMTEIFLGREAVGDGLRQRDLRRFYRSVFRGVHAPKWAALTLQDRTTAAWLATDRTGVIAGIAASALHGAEWVKDTEPIEVLAGDRRGQPGLIVRRDRIGDDERTVIAGLPVTTPARTAFDLGRHLKRPEALARMDALMRAAPYAVDDVQALAARYGPVRGGRQLRELLPLVDAGAASLPESRLRLRLIDDGLPVPETQIAVYADEGWLVGYLDMGWRGIKLAVEYDGDQHRTDRRQYVRDIRRLPLMESLGWEVVRVVKEDRPAEVLQRVRAAYLRLTDVEMDDFAEVTRKNWPKREFGREGAA